MVLYVMIMHSLCIIDGFQWGTLSMPLLCDYALVLDSNSRCVLWRNEEGINLGQNQPVCAFFSSWCRLVKEEDRGREIYCPYLIRAVRQLHNITVTMCPFLHVGVSLLLSAHMFSTWRSCVPTTWPELLFTTYIFVFVRMALTCRLKVRLGFVMIPAVSHCKAPALIC